MLVSETLFGVEDKVEMAIELIREYEPPEGYVVAVSGGKDSTVIYHLTKMAGVKAQYIYNFTTVDTPELLQFLRKNFPDVQWIRPRKSMFQLIIDRGIPPISKFRYCCRELKELSTKDQFVITGVRAQESSRRRNRSQISYCHTLNKRFLRPIFYWTEEDVWEFHDRYNLPHCSLYDEGYDRIGCVLCPLVSRKKRLRDAERYPNFVNAYKRAFDLMIKRRIEKGNPAKLWNSGEEVWEWWMKGREAGSEIKDVEDVVTLYGEEEEEEDAVNV